MLLLLHLPTLYGPAMTERIRISVRTRRKPSREGEERVRKHTGTRKSWLHSATQGWHYVACVRAQCGFQATKGSSQARPRMEWKLAFDRALGSGFQACEAEWHAIHGAKRTLGRVDPEQIELSNFLSRVMNPGVVLPDGKGRNVPTVWAQVWSLIG